MKVFSTVVGLVMALVVITGFLISPGTGIAWGSVALVLVVLLVVVNYWNR